MSMTLTKIGQNGLMPQSTAVVQAAAAAEETKCLFLAAAQWPRDTIACRTEIMNACTDRVLAESALYAYRRGGQLIEGASIDLIEEISTIWGRINSGWIELERQPGQSRVLAYALDYQTLKKDQREFWVEHKGEKGNVLTDSRDIYERIANSAQRRKRSCVEAIIPKYIVQAAVDQVKETLLGGKDAKPFHERVAILVKTFYDKHGVTRPQIEKKIGSKIEAMAPTQYVQLVAIGKSISDGAPADQYFEKIGPEMEIAVLPATAAAEQTEAAAEPGKQRGGRRGNKAAQPTIATSTSQPENISTTPATDAVQTPADTGAPSTDQSATSAPATSEPPEMDLGGSFS